MQLLRHSDPTFSRMSTERYHQFLSTRIKVLFFSAADEASDPKGADEIYRSASDYLREVTRNTKKFKLLFADNITYGFRRNALGLKSIGISMCASTIALQLAIVGARFFSAKARDIRSLAASMNGYDWIVLGVAFGLLMMWTLYFTKSNVKSAAYDYAKKLVLACDTLEASAASPKANRGRRAAPRAPT